MTLLTNNTLDSATIEDQSCDYELVTTSLGRPDCRIGTRPVAGAQDTPAMSTSLSAHVKLLECQWQWQNGAFWRPEVAQRRHS
jgi:hypothetical protein